MFQFLEAQPETSRVHRDKVWCVPGASARANRGPGQARHPDWRGRGSGLWWGRFAQGSLLHCTGPANKLGLFRSVKTGRGGANLAFTTS